LHHLALYEALVTEGLAGASIKDAATTTIYFGGETVGAEPAILTDLDSMITFDLHREGNRFTLQSISSTADLAYYKKNKPPTHTRKSRQKPAAFCAAIKIWSR